MHALVLVGGLGTRLRALYPDRPKALVPVAGRPFLAWFIDELRRQGVSRVHLAAGYRADQVVSWCQTQPVTAALTVSIEPEPLGTAGGLRFAAPHVDGEEFLVLNGDSFLPGLDLTAWQREPLPATSAASLAVTRIEHAGRYGTVELATDGRITAFLEKADRQGGWVNGGVYRVRRSILDLIPEQGACSLETAIFPRLAGEQRLLAHRVPPPLLDMGTPEGLQAMEAFLARRT
jgi:NDP-sugar pyrophosphorylase family protein